MSFTQSNPGAAMKTQSDLTRELAAGMEAKTQELLLAAGMLEENINEADKPDAGQVIGNLTRAQYYLERIANGSNQKTRTPDGVD